MLDFQPCSAGPHLAEPPREVSTDQSRGNATKAFQVERAEMCFVVVLFPNSVIKFQMLTFLGIWPFQRPLPSTQNPCATTTLTLPLCPFYTPRFRHEKQTAYNNIYVLLVTILEKKRGKKGLHPKSSLFQQ